MTKTRWIEMLAVFTVLSFLLWQDHGRQREHYRSMVVTQRTLANIDRTLSGVIEQTEHLEATRDEHDTRLRGLERFALMPATGH